VPQSKPYHKSYAENINKRLLMFFSTVVNCSHFRLIDWCFEYLHISIIAALCWGLVQSVLTYYFFPEILHFLMVTVGIHFAIPQAVLYLAVAATFTTLFMIGKSVKTTRLCSKIQQALESNSSIGKTLAIALILFITHFLAFGYMLEWFAKASMLLPIPVWASWIICSLAIMNLLLFSVERCMNTINVIFENNHNSAHQTEPAYHRIGVRIGLNLSMHLALFTFLGILPLHYIYPLSALGVFLLLYAFECYDYKKSLWQNIDNIIYDWVFLITHASAEGGVAAAGIFLWLQNFVTNASLLHVLVVCTLIASIACEELEDMVHNEDGDTNIEPLKHKKANPELQKLAQALLGCGMEHDLVCQYLSLSKIDPQEPTLDKKSSFTHLLASLSLKDIVFLVKKSHLQALSTEDLFTSEITEGQWLQADLPLHLFSKRQGSYAPFIDKWLRINMLILLFICLMGLNAFTITLLAGANGYYSYQVGKRFHQHKYRFKQSITELWQVATNRLFAQILFYACMITALCLGINGGLEFLHMCGTNMAIVFFIAIAGVIIESSVFFDQIKSGDEAENDDEVKYPITSFLFNKENLLASIGLLSMAASMGVILVICNIVNLGAAVCAGIGLLAVYGEDVFASFKYALIEGSAAEMLLVVSPILVLMATLCTIACGSMMLCVSLLPYYASAACVTSLMAAYICQGKGEVIAVATQDAQQARASEIHLGISTVVLVKGGDDNKKSLPLTISR